MSTTFSTTAARNSGSAEPELPTPRPNACPLATAPAWATDHDHDSDGVTWRHRVSFDHVEVDGHESLTVEAYVTDFLEVDTDGVHIDRGTAEIQLTRSGGGDEGFPLRFEIGDAREVAATIVALCGTVDGGHELGAPLTVWDDHRAAERLVDAVEEAERMAQR